MAKAWKCYFNEELFAKEYQILFVLTEDQTEEQVIITKCSLHKILFQPRKWLIQVYWEKCRILEETFNDDKMVLMPAEATVRKKIHFSWTFRIRQKLTISLWENLCKIVLKRGQYEGKASQMKEKMSGK